MTGKAETFSDHQLIFTLPARNARGRVVRLDAVLNEVLAAHDYPPPIANLLAEALVLTALMGGLVKEPGSQLSIQAQTKTGVVRLLVCDYRAGELRGYAEFDEAQVAPLGANPTLSSLFGAGFLAVTYETGQKRRYQGIVPLQGNSLAKACESYFQSSEQVPTLLKVAISTVDDRLVAGGVLLQNLAESEEGKSRLHIRDEDRDWEHVMALAASLTHDELVDSALSMEAIVWRLFHEEDQLRVLPGDRIEKGCRCTREHYETILARFPEDEREKMRDEDGRIIVDCAFCSRQFALAI